MSASEPSTRRERASSGYLLVLDDEYLGDVEAARAAVAAAAGVDHVRCVTDDAALADGSAARGDAAVLFVRLGVAVVVAAEAPVVSTAGAAAGIIAVEPERVLHALPIRRATAVLTDPVFVDTDTLTWGLQAVGADVADTDGAGVTVAVLDTGVDLAHPDLVGREVVSRSFVEGESAQDGNGHGTHCAGTVGGPRDPQRGPGYGVAPAARLLVGKVLGDAGGGTDADILAGLSWAIAAGAEVVSMSLGADEREVSVAYETVGRRALAAGTLIVAAAGNNADRAGGDPGFVGVPANSPSILAVGAVDAGLAVADFSASATAVDGGEIDIAGPGVAVYSSWPMPQRYDTVSGTSMATPHVAGAAACWAQRTGARGQDLWDVLVGATRSLPAPVEDVGAGLVQVPR